MLSQALGLAVGVVSSACLATSFQCSEDTDCQTGDTAGFCEATGYCAFGDDACPSGRRYGDFAEQGLAMQCVPVPQAGTGGGDEPQPSSGTTADSAGSATTTGASTTTTTGSATMPADPTTPDPSGGTTGPVSPETDGSGGVDPTDPDPSGSTSGNGSGNDGSGQPNQGMYAHCLDGMYENCTSPSDQCVNLDEATGTDGFCTITGCTDPMADCTPIPSDSDATPVCAEARDAMDNPVFLCALSCADGETCPAGMVCVANLSFMPGLPVYDFCM